MKIKATGICFLIAFCLIFGPLLFDWQINSWLYYAMCLVGVMLAGMVGYGAQMSMLGNGDTGEALLKELWKKLKAQWRK